MIEINGDKIYSNIHQYIMLGMVSWEELKDSDKNDGVS